MLAALITVITGQDGSYLAEYLLSKGYEVIGMVRRSSTVTYERIQNIRKSYHLFTVSGNLFNHESPRRGLEFVTRKISDGVARIKLGLAKELHLGNLEARRDWGFAGEYVQAMWKMLQQEHPDDFVIGTGETHSVREYCEHAFQYVGLNYQDYVVQDPRYLRPSEVDLLLSDTTKARQKLGWMPKVAFGGLVEMMVEADLQRLTASEK
jgi:GDPmannose 4,6-dehydratase